MKNNNVLPPKLHKENYDRISSLLVGLISAKVSKKNIFKFFNSSDGIILRTQARSYNYIDQHRPTISPMTLICLICSTRCSKFCIQCKTYLCHKCFDHFHASKAIRIEKVSYIGKRMREEYEKDPSNLPSQNKKRAPRRCKNCGSSECKGRGSGRNSAKISGCYHCQEGHNIYCTAKVHKTEKCTSCDSNNCIGKFDDNECPNINILPYETNREQHEDNETFDAKEVKLVDGKFELSDDDNTTEETITVNTTIVNDDDDENNDNNQVNDANNSQNSDNNATSEEQKESAVEEVNEQEITKD